MGEFEPTTLGSDDVWPTCNAYGAGASTSTKPIFVDGGVAVALYRLLLFMGIPHLSHRTNSRICLDLAIWVFVYPCPPSTNYRDLKNWIRCDYLDLTGWSIIYQYDIYYYPPNFLEFPSTVPIYYIINMNPNLPLPCLYASLVIDYIHSPVIPS